MTLVITPKVALFAVQQVPFGLLKAGELVTEKASARICKPNRSVT